MIYKGPFFSIEWFYDEKGYSQPYEYFLKTSACQKRKFLLLVKKMGDFGKIIVTNAFRKKGDKLPTQEKTTAVKTMEKYFLIHKEDKEE